MVSTRNAAPSASLNRPKTNRGGRENAAPSSVPHASTAVSSDRSPSHDSHFNGSRRRKRGRVESISNNDAPLSSGPPLGDETSPSKRAKIQARPAEPSRRSRRTVESAAQDVPVSTVQATAVGAGHLNLDTPMPNEVTANDGYHHQGFGSMSMDDSTRISLQGLQLRNQSLPVLDNFATQILSVTATNSFHEIFDMATNPLTGPGQQWSQLITLFSETKKVYASHDPFLSSQKLGFSEIPHINVIRKANVATFVCGLFGGREDVGFSHLNESFLDTFVTESPIMFESHAQLFLELKTQAYISAVTNDKAAIISGHRTRQEVLDAIFPSQLGDDLLHRRSKAAQHTPTESELVERAESRRQALLQESDSEVAINMLPSKYPWEDFLKDVHFHIASTFNHMAGRISPKAFQDTRFSNIDSTNRKAQAQTASHVDQQGIQPSQSHEPLGSEATQLQAIPSTSNDVAEKAARAAHYAMTNFGTIEQQRPAVQRGPQAAQEIQASVAGPPIQFHFERPLHPNVPSPPAPSFTQVTYQNDQMQGQWHPNSGANGQPHQLYDADGMIPYPTQSAPTHVLYERARQAASTKPSQHPTPRKATTNTPTQRRPWTAEEENALMAGLDRVKGPHWSQIHAMFGPGGTINEVLKNRSQVQLKDKARNLKLFFLKGNIEVPYYLQFVTGELKTRAPSRLAKNEAKGRMMSEEDRAHVQGVMTLAGTANAMQEEDQSNLLLGDVHVERNRNDLGLSDPVGNDVNIDPALEAQLRNAAGGADMVYGSRYTVPTPNMILESLDRFSGTQDAQQQSQR